MSSHQTNEDDCPPCEILAKKIQQLCDILGDGSAECKNALSRLQSGEVDTNDIADNLFSDLTPEKMKALDKWMAELKSGLDVKRY